VIQRTLYLMLSSSTANLCGSEIGLGVCSRHTSLNTLPGWRPSSWAYYGDDGRLFAESESKTQRSETFGTGDIIGCQVSFNDGVTFTKNGTSLGKDIDEHPSHSYKGLHDYIQG
jgi:hypothetical protein